MCHLVTGDSCNGELSRGSELSDSFPLFTQNKAEVSFMQADRVEILVYGSESQGRANQSAVCLLWLALCRRIYKRVCRLKMWSVEISGRCNLMHE